MSGFHSRFGCYDQKNVGGASNASLFFRYFKQSIITRGLVVLRVACNNEEPIPDWTQTFDAKFSCRSLALAAPHSGCCGRVVIIFVLECDLLLTQSTIGIILPSLSSKQKLQQGCCSPWTAHFGVGYLMVSTSC